ncbi:hypothetical protein Nmel_001756 [Mimus melanotis]
MRQSTNYRPIKEQLT